jgi:predicted 3-demethylubiquinone-9 3-methyltransferase (glyoxalase superfamily)
MSQKITPFLWFDNNAEEAMNFYVSVFKDAKIINVNRLPEVDDEHTKGGVVTGSFELFGQEFNVINGGPSFKFTEAISFVVDCKDQTEVDYYWEKLTADGGEESQCGWLKDKFGLSWQIIPEGFVDTIADSDPEKSKRAMAAMMKMKKLDLEALKRARDGK